MAAVQARQPFGVLDSTRLQKLTSVKNCQNAITNVVQSPTSKQTLVSPGKRRLSITAFDESEDSENIDPATLNSPSKRSKNANGTPVKVSRFLLNTTTSPARPAVSAAQKPLSLSLPPTTTATPISASRGSPKHPRVGLLAKGRRASSSPFRRIDPPSFSTPSGGLPFSIDEALKGSTRGTASKASIHHPIEPAVPAAAPLLNALPQQHMPKGWFFDIYEDTPEEEAANLMEHSASVLDISSDDDATTRRGQEEREKGKENIPPPDQLVANPANVAAGANATAVLSSSQDVTAQTPGAGAKNLRGRKALHPDAMVEDRAALGELPAQEFYSDGLDASSNVIVPGDSVTSPQKPSGLSKEFDFAVPSPRAKLEAAREGKGKGPAVEAQSKEIFICEDEL